MTRKKVFGREMRKPFLVTNRRSLNEPPTNKKDEPEQPSTLQTVFDDNQVQCASAHLPILTLSDDSTAPLSGDDEEEKEIQVKQKKPKVGDTASGKQKTLTFPYTMKEIANDDDKENQDMDKKNKRKPEPLNQVQQDDTGKRKCFDSLKRGFVKRPRRTKAKTNDKCFATNKRVELDEDDNAETSRRKKAKVNSDEPQATMMQLDIHCNTNEESMVKATTNAVTSSRLSLTSSSQPNPKTSLRKARAFFEQLDRQALVVERHKRLEGEVLSPVGPSRPVQRTRRVLSLRDPGVAKIYQTHVEVSREVGVEPLPLQVFWKQHRNTLQRTSDHKLALYDGFFEDD